MNKTELRNLIVKAIEIRGEGYVYPESEKEHMITDSGEPGALSCLYFKNNEPRCIVGMVIYLNGGGPDDVEEFKPAFNFVGEVLNVDANLANAIQYMQEAQDLGKSWGEALEVFDTETDHLV